MPHLVKLTPGVTSPHIAKVATHFYRAMLCISAVYAITRCLCDVCVTVCVCLSVRLHVRELRQNEYWIAKPF